MRILFADKNDHPALCRSLEEAGHQTETVSEGLDAWNRFIQEPFPLVIAGCDLDGIDGRQFCRQIREVKSAPYTYVILLDPRCESQTRIDNLESGADAVLAGPLTADELLSQLHIVERTLGGHQALHEHCNHLERQNQNLGETIYWLESANHRFSELFAGLPAACYSYDDQGRIFEWNRAAEEMFGYAPEEACHHLIWQLFAEEEPERQAENVRRRRAMIQQVLAGESLIGIEVEAHRRDRTPLHLLCNTIPVRASDGRITGIISANLDITERRRLEEQVSSQLRRMTELNTELACQKDELAKANARLAEIATTDGLTGLKNHRFLQETLQACYSFARRHNLPMSVLMVDVDQFKIYNDTYGHPAGDDVLRTISSLLQGSVRDHDTVARYGGEEFVILLPATAEPEASQVAERLRSAIEAHPWPMRAMTASFGVATFSPGVFPAPPNHAALLDEADRALYFSKQQGRNCITLGACPIPEGRRYARTEKVAA